MATTEPTKRMADVPLSGIRKVANEVDRLTKLGKRVLNLTIGRPDFDTPEHIKEAAKKALDDGFVHYTSNAGIDELRIALAEKLKNENGIDVSPAEVVITIGANEAVSMAITGMLDDGQEVICPDPSWPHYWWCAKMIGAVPVALPILERDNFEYNLEEIQKRITPKTKMLIVNTPHNPGGSVTPRETLEKIAQLAIERNLIVVADEIYEKLIYDDAEHVSLASLPGMRERTITINGFSKAYSMTGWRLGYIAAPKEMIASMIKVHAYTTSCATSFAQKGALAAVTGPQDCVEQMRLEFDRRRKLIIERVPKIPGLSMRTPRGAFYAFINITGLGMTAEQASDFFLSKAGVALVPGTALGQYGEGYVRLAYSAAYDVIDEALTKMEEAIKSR